MSIDQWIGKEDVVPIYTMECYSTVKKRTDWIGISCSEMDGPRACYTVWSQEEKQILHINA